MYYNTAIKVYNKSAILYIQIHPNGETGQSIVIKNSKKGKGVHLYADEFPAVSSIIASVEASFKSTSSSILEYANDALNALATKALQDTKK